MPWPGTESWARDRVVAATRQEARIQVEDGRDFKDHRPWRRGWVVEAISLTLPADLPQHGNGSKPGTLIFTLKQAGFLEV